jgi:hypothetical protein
MSLQLEFLAHVREQERVDTGDNEIGWQRRATTNNECHHHALQREPLVYLHSKAVNQEDQESTSVHASSED